MRFSNFANAWSIFELKDLVKFGLGLTHTPTYKDSGVVFISSKNISGDKLDLTDINYVSSEEYSKMSPSVKPQKGDILFTRVGSNLGHPVIFDGNIEIAIFVSLGYLRCNYQVNNCFIKHWMNSNHFWSQVKEKVGGSSKFNLNTGWISKFKIGIPNSEEQIKISFLLNKIDERIDTQNKIISAKKSLMKNIVVGMKNDSASSVALCSIAEIYQPQTLAQNELIPGDYYVYGANGIIGKHNRYNHENEEICLTCRGSTCGNLCLSKPFSWINGNAMVIKTNNNINKHFIYYALLKINWSKYISGSGQPQIVRSAIQNIRINLPDIEIQNKISIVLDTLNDSIEAELLLLNKLNVLKRYLLSNLFI